MVQPSSSSRSQLGPLHHPGQGRLTLPPATLLLFIYLLTCNDSFQTNHLIIYRTDLRQICRVVAVDDRSEIIFFGRLYPQN